MAALPTVQGTAATAAIEGLAEAHPHPGRHIRQLGNVFLLLSRGLRDGRGGASRTYDLSFVNDHGAFACLTAESVKHDNATEGRLQVQLRHQGDRELDLFKLKQTGSEIKRGWRETQLGRRRVHRAPTRRCSKVVHPLRVVGASSPGFAARGATDGDD